MTESLFITGAAVFDGHNLLPSDSAVFIRHGLIAARGPCEQLERGIPKATRRLELPGRLLMPGFHDAHSHLLGAGILAQDLQLKGSNSLDEILGRVAGRVQGLAAGEWIIGRGWADDELDRIPTRSELDRASGSRPVFLARRDGHGGVANTAALDAAGLTHDASDPVHGRVGRDNAGERTGLVLEAAFEQLRRSAPLASWKRRVRAAESMLEGALSLGITSIQDDCSWDSRLDAFAVYRAALESKPGPRITLWQDLGRPLLELNAERERDGLLRSPEGRSRLSYGLLKGYLDGSLGSRTATLLAPYEDEPENSGLDLMSAERCRELVARAHGAGFQVGLHTIGDRAARLALDAIEAAGPIESLRGRRHRLEHVQVLDPRDRSRFAELGAIASVQPIHLADDRAIVRSLLGPERSASSYCWRGLLDAGAPLAFGTDHPVAALDPLLGIAMAVQRSVDGQEPWHIEQGISLTEALSAYTYGAAYAAGQEQQLGSLVPGQSADIAVLSRDLFKQESSPIADAKCELTILAGEIVYRRP